MSLDPAAAAEVFADMVIDCVYDSSLHSMDRVLRTGLDRNGATEAERCLSRWFSELDQHDMLMVSRIVEQAVNSAVFGMLVLLDGATGGYPLTPTPSGFALYLHEYGTSEHESEEPTSSVRIDGEATGTDLHDLYTWLLSQREATTPHNDLD